MYPIDYTVNLELRSYLYIQTVLVYLKKFVR